MDLSTTPRRPPEGVAEHQKMRIAKSVFSIRSLVDVEDSEFTGNEEERNKGQINFILFYDSKMYSYPKKHKLDPTEYFIDLAMFDLLF